jgi:hypothetical protein
MSQKTSQPTQDVFLSKEQVKANILFTPCKDKDTLRTWIKVYFGVDIPDCIVDETSTGTPMDMIWDVYSHFLNPKETDPGRVLYYASRDSFKCQEKGTLILTKEKGLVPIEDIVLGDKIWSGWNWRKVTDWIHDGVKESVALETEAGHRSVGSPIHRLWAWQPGKEPGWVKMSDLTPNDLVCLDTTHGYWDSEWSEEDFEAGFTWGKRSVEGEIPRGLMRSRGAMAGVASGLLESAGRVYRGNVEVGLDWVTARDLQVVLSALGVNSRNEMYALCGVITIDRLDTPGLIRAGVRFSKLGTGSPGPCENKWVRVKSVTAGSADFYDLSVEGDHSYWSNGLISHNTLSESILEALSVLHLQIDVVHLAAIEVQSKNAQKYVKKFFRRQPMLKYMVGNNSRMVEIVRYHNKFTGENLSSDEFALINDIEKAKYREIRNTIEIIVATVESCNGKHAPLLCVSGDTTITVSIGSRPPQDISVSDLFSSLSGHSSDGTVFPDPSFKILSRNKATGHNEYKSIQLINSSKKATVAVKTIGGKSLRCTSDHPFLVPPVYREVPAVSLAGSTVYLEAGEDCVSSVIGTCEVERVFDLNIDDNHNFFANGILVKNCLDEIDILPDPEAYEEAKMIPSEKFDEDNTESEKVQPITVLTSTRKYSIGFVQKEIDEASRTKLQVKHWNIIDVTEPCPAKRHRPDLPKVTIYRSDDLLQFASEDQYSKMAADEQAKYVKDEGFSGCLTNCSLFPMCKGRLATHQKSKSKMLKTIKYTTDRFEVNSIEKAKAQLLCWKPSSIGMIYPNLDKATHMRTPAQIYEMVFGVAPASTIYNKQDLISDIKSKTDARWYAGMDFGFTHNFVVVVGFVYDNRCYVVDCHSQADLEVGDQIALCEAKVKPLDPWIFADPENPQAVKTFRKEGFKMRQWKKGKGSVIGGIDIVRYKIKPALGKPQMFFLNDPGCEFLVDRMSRYHWKIDAKGEPTDVPDDEKDDECFVGGTEVLTPNGWVRMDELKGGEVVMGCDESGVGSCHWQESELVKKAYEGVGWKVDTDLVSFVSTEDHPHAICVMGKLVPCMVKDMPNSVDILLINGIATIPKTSFEQVHLDETVFCVRVPSRFFLARYNGKPFVAKNCDAARYLVMNVFSSKGKMVYSEDRKQDRQEFKEDPATKKQVDNTWMKNIISEKTGGQSQLPGVVIGSKSGKKGGLKWTF